MNLTIRKATKEDAEFVAVSILDAVGIEKVEQPFFSMITGICKREDTLYSWRNTIVAEVDGVVAGSLTSYDGNEYATMRKLTFELVMQQGGHDFSDMDMEAYPGEYYLDSLSVRPEFRRQGIATALLNKGIEVGREMGAKSVTLACEPNNQNAYRLYCSLGFEHRSDMFIFGEDYWKMVIDTTH